MTEYDPTATDPEDDEERADGQDLQPPEGEGSDDRLSDEARQGIAETERAEAQRRAAEEQQEGESD